MTTLEILKAARAKIANPENWTRGVYARTKDDECTNPNTADACKFCVLGSLHSVTTGMSQFCEVTHELRQYIPEPKMLSLFNDNESTTHADVLKLFDTAIERLTLKENGG